MIPSIRFMQKRYNLKSSAGVLVSYPARWFRILKYLVRRK
jgi:hypothetical protein